MTGRARPGGRFLTTILFTDIVGSTDVAAQVGDASWRKLVAAHHQAIRTQLRRFGGKEIDTAGDGFFASFEQPAQAVRAADAMLDQAARLGLSLRAGVHTGEAEQIGPKVGGIAVHIASRVMASANGGEVLVSSTVHDLVAGSGLDFSDRGVQSLKGVPGEWRLFALLRPNGLPVAQMDASMLARTVEQPRRRRRLMVGGAAVVIIVAALLGIGGFALLSRGSGTAIPAAPNTVVALNESGQVVDVRQVAVGPVAVTVDQQDVWIAALDAGVVQSLPRSGSAAGHTIGRVGQPTGVILGGRQLWVADEFDQSIALLDPTTGATNATVHMPAAALAFGMGSAWDVDDITDSIHRLDDQTGDIVSTIALDAGAFPNAIAVATDAVWVTNGATSTVTRLDPSTNSVAVAAIALRSVPDSVVAGSTDVWIGSRAADSVIRLDPASNNVAATISVCDQPRALAADGTTLWVACAGPGEVWHLDHDGKQLSITPVNGEPTDLLMDNDRVWVTVRQP